jgi:hypothetical protein
LVTTTIVINAIEGDEYIDLKCVPLGHNKIEVRVRKATVKSILEVYDTKGAEPFQWEMKTLVKNLPRTGRACFLGWMGEEDFNTAVAMFTAGIKEVKMNWLKLQASSFPFLYMVTERGQAYDPKLALFHVGN